MKYILLSLALITGTAQAGLLDTITTVVGGHVSDAVNRFNAEDQVVQGTVIKEGSIREDDPGQDFLHNAKGSVSLIEKDGTYYVQLGSDFDSSPGPDYHVYVSTSASITKESDFNSTVQHELGELLQGKGASFYEVTLPRGVHAKSIQSVTIWCKAFGEFIGSATISSVR